MQLIREIFDRAILWIVYGSRASIDEVVGRFPISDQQSAREFYNSWPRRSPFMVSLGDCNRGGLYDDTSHSFFSEAVLAFAPTPFRVGQFLVVAQDMANPSASVAVDCVTEKVFVVYDVEPGVAAGDHLTFLLSKSFAEFLDTVKHSKSSEKF